MQDTSKQYDTVINECRSLFVKKMADYGSAWRILRLHRLQIKYLSRPKESVNYKKTRSEKLMKE